MYIHICINPAGSIHFFPVRPVIYEYTHINESFRTHAWNHVTHINIYIQFF